MSKLMQKNIFKLLLSIVFGHVHNMTKNKTCDLSVISLFKYMYAGRFIVSPSTSYDKWSNFKLRLGDKFCFPLFTNFYNSSKELESVLFTSGVQSV